MASHRCNYVDTITSSTTQDIENSETKSPESESPVWSSRLSSYQSRIKVAVLKKNCISPYTKKAKKTEEKQRMFLLSPKSNTQSSVVSKRSETQDSSSHQMRSVPSSDRISKLVSYKSSTTNNFFFLSRSKRNRPVSAPPGQLRCPMLPPSKFHLAQKASEVPRIFKRQPEILRVTAYKNGTINTFVKVAVPPSIRMLLEECTEKLKLNMAARRVFLADGTEALDAIDIPHDADVYISTGEPFSNPFKKIKDHLVLMKNATWTLNGVVLPGDVKKRKAKLLLSKQIKNLSEKPTVRLLVFKNCMGQDGSEITAPLGQTEKFLDACTMRLNLTSPAKYLYNMHGEKVEDLSSVPLLDKCLQNTITPLRGPLWVSKGEGFSPSGAKMYIQGVLLALHQQLKSAKNYYEQLDSAMDGQKEKITIKSILSLKKEELWEEQDEVNKLIDELQAAIRNYKGHLCELAPQLQAEQEQCAAYVYQHIKELPASTSLAQSLQLKVYENGKDSGEIIVYINKKEIESNCGNQPSAMLEKVLHMIHQRLQHSADFKPSGLSHFPTRLFEETGQEIKNPLLLQNEQKIWVSYGEDYRSPLNPVLSLTYDRVTAAEKYGNTIIYKTLLDHTVDLLPGCDNWKICAGFPKNFQVSKNLEPGSETVGTDNHFVQYKADPQMVLFMSVTMENLRKASPRRNYQQDVISSSSLWPFSNVWLITKTGMILSRAVAQSSLALGHPIRVVIQDGIRMEGYKLSLQKRDKTNIYQYWEFGNDGSIHSKAYPEFVLTYLEELNVKEVTQMEYHTHHGAQSASLRSSPRQFLQNNIRDYDVKQLSRPLDAHSVPEGPLEENRQLTVAVVRKLEEKHPKASAQRWAIKHEGTSKPGQWKQSKVDNPLWNKLTLMWPVLPNGELNEDFAWPIEGFLIPNSPPLKKPACKKADSYMAVRLRVLRNGELDKTKAVTILGSDYSTRMKKSNAESEKKQKEKKVQKMCVEGNSEKEVHRTEFQHFLERCTMLLNLPFAARRLFTEKGVEILFLKDLERDKLVYVSCGEQWLDPQVTMVQHKKRLQLSNLAADITTVSAFCVMRNPKNLVLEVKSDITVGAKLSIEKARVEVEGEKVVEEPEEKQAEEKSEQSKDEAYKCLNSHEKSHLRSDEWFISTKYPWQHNSHDFDEYCNLEKETFFENAELYQKYRHQPKLTEDIQKAHHQQFEFRNGKIINCNFPNLVLGVKNSELHPGTEVILLEKKCGDINQHWIWKESSRTFHLVADTNLVLAVSMPKILNGSPRISMEMQGCAVIVQKYKEYINGAANQKWNYTDITKTFSAFCSTILDQEITAANHASICTFSVTNREKIDQPGYSFLSPGGKQKVMICLACARTMRGKKELEKLIPGTLFFCASGSEEGNHLCVSPFKCLNVKKTDLSTSEAEGTLHYLEDVLASLRTETSSQIISEKMSAVVNQKAVKIMAYKNGAGYRNGQLIIASTFPMLLSLCTRRLELNRPACKLYNSEGTLILTMQDLVLYAVNDYYRKQKSEEKDEKAHIIPGPDEDTPELSTEVYQSEEMYSNSKSSVMTLDLNMIDDSLLTTILKTPIEVWASSGESFMSLTSVEIAERQDKQNWLEKDKILADLDAMKHKMRQLQGRRMSKHKAANLVPTKSPHHPVVVEGGWTEETPEEMKLMEEIQHLEMHLSELQALQMKRSTQFSPKLHVKNHRDLYNQPTTKRVWVYPNGHRPEQGTHAWGKTVEELLDSCTIQLKLPQSAKALYTSDGEQLQSWDEIERDMIVCVSTGPPFLSRKAAKHEMEVRALYARIRKQQGPEATNIVVVPSEKTTGQVTSSNSLMALPWKNDQQSSD